MEIREILDAFARYTEYDRKSEKTQISWDDYEYQLAGDKIQNLIGEYDQTGILSVLYAKKILLKMAGKKKFTIEQYLTDQKIQEKIKKR